MERLLEMALKVSEQVEVYSIQETKNTVSFENSHLKNMAVSIQSGLSLRIVKDGKLGFAYTKNLIDRNGVLNGALSSLKGGAEAPGGFPGTQTVRSLDTYDDTINAITGDAIVEECQRVCNRLSSGTTAQLNLESGHGQSSIRILNSSGADLSCRASFSYMAPALLFPGSYAAIHRVHLEKSFEKTPQDILDHILNTFSAAQKQVKPAAGRMKVIFLPESLYVLMWRLRHATSGKALYQNESPLAKRIGAKIFSDQLTVVDDPLNDSLPSARSFDDEATPCRCMSLVENGILQNYYYDLFYAKKMGVESSGHGYKTAMWGGDTVSLKIFPSLEHLFIEPGDQSFESMLKSMDRGVIVCRVLGAHSGNIPNGDYSVGLSPGIYVEGGEIVGHVKDAMIAGNIYVNLKNIIAIEDSRHFTSGGCFPAILIDDVNIQIK